MTGILQYFTAFAHLQNLYLKILVAKCLLACAVLHNLQQIPCMRVYIAIVRVCSYCKLIQGLEIT